MKIFYNFIQCLSQTIRKRNYKFYRMIVELPILQKIVKKVSHEKNIEVLTPEGFQLSVNPIYHGNHLSTRDIAAYEPDLRTLLNLIVKPNMVIYDIGENVGVFSLCCLNQVGDEGWVYAFEPEENNIQCLNGSKEINQLKNLKIEQVCIGDKSGVQLFDRRGGGVFRPFGR